MLLPGTLTQLIKPAVLMNAVSAYTKTAIEEPVVRFLIKRCE